MANKGKYIDRNPELQAAGKLFENVENIGDSLQNYSAEEAAFNIMTSKCKKLQKNAQENEVLRYSQFLPKENLKDLLSPELRKSRFVTFKEKFSEDMFFQKPQIGKATALPSKPVEFTNENFIYGLKHEATESLYELVLPNKTTQEVDEDFIKWHDKYVISHKHYLPEERIQRKYNDHFKSDAAYGLSTNADTTGRNVKKCLQHCDRTLLINNRLKKFQDHQIGKRSAAFDRYDLNLPINQTFGKPSKNQDNFTARALIENIESCPKNIEITEALLHVNDLRRRLFIRSDFHMNDLRTILKLNDNQGSGYVKFGFLMKLLRSLQIRANEQKIRTAILHFQMFKDGCETSELVSAQEFWKMLHIQYPLPLKINTKPTKEICAKHTTTYRLLCSDRIESNAVPQIYSRLPCYDATTAKDLVAPDTAMRYGLRLQDFQISRPREELKAIFRNLPPEMFDKIWQLACPKQTGGQSSCQMSVEEFKTYLDDYNRQLQ